MILGDINHLSQHCRARERTIKDAAAGIRHVVVFAQQTQRAIRVLSLDFRTAFDKLSHDYLYIILNENGSDFTSVAILQALYKNGISRCDVNTFLLERFRIECSVRQGWPLSNDHVRYSTQTLVY